jgi:AP-1 complex subunit gamma-1
MSSDPLNNLKIKASSKVKEFISTAQAKREQVERSATGNHSGKHSLAYKCVRLRELVRLVRNAKTQAEERSIIAKESAAIRDAFADSRLSGPFRHRNVAKLLFMHMLGYPTHFGQMECVQLTAMPDFANKRLGYLGLMVLMDERSEVTMLTTNSVKSDLMSKNVYVVGLGLCALGNICTSEMARDVSEEVRKLMLSKNSYVRKKAALCAIRVVKKVPELAESFLEPCERLLNDRHHGVLLAAVTLAYRLCEGPSDVFEDTEDVRKADEIDGEFDEDAADRAVERLRKKVGSLCKVLKSLNSQQTKKKTSASGSSSAQNNGNQQNEHDVGGHSDPFLQVNILKLLKVLGRGCSETSDEMSDTLAHVASNTEFSSKNLAGASILLECVECIVETESVGGLRVLAVNILGKFLASKENNAKYVALTALSSVVKIDQGAVQRHRKTIVECVKDSDVSIRKSALNLVYNLVNTSNVRTLVPELLEYLKVADKEFKRNLTKRIATLIAENAPDDRWRCEMTVETFRQAGEFMDDVDQRTFCGVVSRGDEKLQALIGRSMFKACVDLGENASQQLKSTTCWVCGEFADCIAHVPTLENEEKNTVTIQDIVALLKVFLKDAKESETTKQYALTAMTKVSARDQSQSVQAIEVMKPLQTSVDLELQARACEYSHIIEAGSEMLTTAMERVPPPEAPKFVELGKKKRRKSLASSAARASASESEKNKSESAALGDLLDFGGESEAVQTSDVPAASTSPAPKAVAAANVLDDLFADIEPMPTPAPVSSSLPFPATEKTATKQPEIHHSPQVSLEDLLGGGDVSISSAPASASKPTPSQSVDPLADLFGDVSATPAQFNANPQSMGAMAATPTSATGLLDAFDATTPANTMPASTSANTSASPLDDMFGGLSMDAPPSVTQAVSQSLSSAPAPAPAPAPVPTPPTPATCTFTAHSSHPLTIVFECSKDSADVKKTIILAKVSSTSPVSSVTLQSAVPKSMTVALEHASGSALKGSGESEVLTQIMRVENSMHGEKSLAMKLRVSYVDDTSGAEKVEMVTVAGFPPKF